MQSLPPALQTRLLHVSGQYSCSRTCMQYTAPWVTLPAALQLEGKETRAEFEVLFAELTAWKDTYRTTLVPKQVHPNNISQPGNLCSLPLSDFTQAGRDSGMEAHFFYCPLNVA